MKDKSSGGAAARSPLRVGVFSLAMTNVVAVASLRDLPQMATNAINPRAFVIFLAVAMTSFCLLPLVLARLRRRR